METFSSLLYGFSIALQPINLFYCFLGAFLGTLIGVLPGIGPVATMSLLLPFTYHLSPVSSLIMLSGIYMGAAYGGSTTSILVNIPGEACSIVTCFDGHQMARTGRAGPALGISAFGSFIAGGLSLLGIAFFAPALAEMALKFGPPEFFSLIFLSMTILTFLSKGSMRKSLVMVALGLILGCVGTDVTTGTRRFVYGVPGLVDGIDVVPMVMGLFGISEILQNVEAAARSEIFAGRIKGLLPSWDDWQKSIKPILRASGLGFFLGIIPGIGAGVTTFVDYAMEKKLSRYPEKFGTGVIEGVAGPESANNAAAQASFIPLFSLGIPATPIMAVLMGALMIHGLQPSPMMMTKSPDLFWGVVSSMYVSNLALLILNLPMIPLWIRLIRIPYSILFTLISVFCVIGAYSIKNDTADIIVMTIFGIVGYLFKKFEYDSTLFILPFILGSIFEIALRQSLTLSRGSLLIFVQRPLSLTLLVIGISILTLPFFFRRHKLALQ